MTGHRPTPAAAWAQLRDGNERFVSGAPQHPRQDVEHRAESAREQRPHAALIGCSDSRLAAEIIFDSGLGDLFVVRNAGQVISDSVIASVEYAIGVLEVPLVVVLGHDACGAVQAAIDAEQPDATPLPPLIAAHIAPIRPAVRRTPGGDPVAVGREHLRDTVAALLEGSELVSDAIAAGTLAVVGANYRLAEGRVEPAIAVGPVETA